jgi:CheY-like chemotaxis protein
LFPLTLGGIWRERLRDHLDQLLNQGLKVTNDSSVERYRRALDTLPSDLNIHGLDCTSALERLRASQPKHSPFLLVRRLSGEDNPS